MKQNISYAILILGSVLAIYMDYKCGKIFNWVTVPMIFIGLFIGLVRHDMLNSIGGFIAAFILFFPFFVKGGMGAGDVKFAMGVGALGGIKLFAYATGISAGIIIIYAIYKKVGSRSLKSTAYMAYSLLKSIVLSILYTLRISAETQKAGIHVQKSEAKTTGIQVKYGVFLGISNLFCLVLQYKGVI